MWETGNGAWRINAVALTSLFDSLDLRLLLLRPVVAGRVALVLVGRLRLPFSFVLFPI